MYAAMEPDASYLDLSGFLAKTVTSKECDELNTPIIGENKNEFDFTSSSDVLVPMADDSDIWGLDSPFNESYGLISPNIKMESKYLEESTFLTPKNEENNIIVNHLVEGINPDFNVSNESLSQSNAFFTSDNTQNVVTEFVDCVEVKTNSSHLDKQFVSQENIEKKLKLNLSLAPPQLETTLINTPDVVQHILNNENNFNILSYVFEDDKTSSTNKHRTLSNPKTNKRTALLRNSKLLNNDSLQQSKDTHSTPLNTIDDSEIRTISSQNIIVNTKKTTDRSETIIKVEPSIEVECPSSSSSRVSSSTKTSTSSTTSKPVRRGRPPGRKNNPPKRPASPPPSDDDLWIPNSSTENRSKRRRTASVVSTDSNHSSHSSVVCSKYRELRDRNNEASRKSRMNRKAREEEMNDKLHILEKDNLKLRVKAEELERLVQEMRTALISAFKKK